MPLPEDYLPRAGDVLSIDVEVKYDVTAGDDYVFTRVIGFHTEVTLILRDPDVRRICRRCAQ
jgi:hypothetical protein